MLSFLFRGLTAEPARGAPLFESVTALARQPHWYVEGKVPDTLDGRFAVLSAIAALVLVRLERDGAAGDSASVALTERFIEVMESEHRELGLGDPTLGKTVRKLVGKLGRRTEMWRAATPRDASWAEATRESLYKKEVDPETLRHSSEALTRLRRSLDEKPLTALMEGKIE